MDTTRAGLPGTTLARRLGGPSAALLLALAATPVRAQDAADAADACPRLPADAGLHWEGRADGATLFCRAVDDAGNEAFGFYVSAEPGFEPSSRNGREQGVFDGRTVTWYKAEIAAAPGVLARETALPLADGRYVHVWLQTDSEEALTARLQLLSGLRLRPTAPVAGP